jgi:hypothetical protein
VSLPFLVISLVGHIALYWQLGCGNTQDVPRKAEADVYSSYSTVSWHSWTIICTVHAHTESRKGLSTFALDHQDGNLLSSANVPTKAQYSVEARQIRASARLEMTAYTSKRPNHLQFLAAYAHCHCVATTMPSRVMAQRSPIDDAGGLG